MWGLIANFVDCISDRVHPIYRLSLRLCNLPENKRYRNLMSSRSVTSSLASASSIVASRPMLRHLRLYVLLSLSSLSPMVAKAEGLDQSVCSFSESAHALGNEAKQFGGGLKHLPRAMIQPANLA